MSFFIALYSKVSAQHFSSIASASVSMIIVINVLAVIQLLFIGLTGVKEIISLVKSFLVKLATKHNVKLDLSFVHNRIEFKTNLSNSFNRKLLCVNRC